MAEGARLAAAQALERTLDRYQRTFGDAPLRAFLTTQGGLPGAKADLALAAAFAESVSGRAVAGGGDWWSLCRDFALMPASRAPTDDPAEFLCICGTLGVATIACLDGGHVGECLVILHRQAQDPRWRLRNATVQALTRLLLARRAPTLAALAAWVGAGAPLQLRAALMALSEPTVLGSAAVADTAARAHDTAVARFLEADRPLTPAWRTLRLALGRSVAALALARPEASLALLRRLSAAHDADARRIVEQNLTDPRLRRLHERDVAEAPRASGA